MRTYKVAIVEHMEQLSELPSHILSQIDLALVRKHARVMIIPSSVEVFDKVWILTYDMIQVAEELTQFLTDTVQLVDHVAKVLSN